MSAALDNVTFAPAVLATAGTDVTAIVLSVNFRLVIPVKTSVPSGEPER